jgi:magnesium transporter
VSQITDFQKLFLSAGFLAYAGVLIAISLSVIFYFGPKYVFIFLSHILYSFRLRRHGKKSMLWYISVCSMIGGISVSVTTGLGSAIVTTAMGDNQV